MLRLMHADIAPVLPDGAEVIEATGYGGSYWSYTGKISLRLKDGSTDVYFIKISTGQTGFQMARGEYESVKMIHSIGSALVPKPIGYGTYESNQETHFYLCEFVELYDELPDVIDFAHDIAALHKRSMKQSSNSMFGFEVPTCNETIVQHTDWTISWEQFFTESLKKAFVREEKVHGSDPDIQAMLPALFEKVCPRLLRPLETGGQVLRPCLVHGDLWDGNIGVRAKTGQPIIYDASALWAHNEYDLHMWRATRYRLGKTFRREYFHHFPKSQPEEDCHDRNLLYSLMADLNSSTHFQDSERFRELLIQSMKELVDKYPKGYEGTCKRKDLATRKQAGVSPARPAYVSLGGYANQ